MKRIYILLLVCMGAMSAMAQGQKLKNRVIDKDYYPVDNAKVTIKGTKLSTVTDKNGNFVIEDVPLILDSIEVVKGDKTYSAETPIRLEMNRALMDKFSWFVKAGWEFPWGELSDLDCGENRIINVGVGIDLKLSRCISFQPSVNLAMRWIGVRDGYYDVDNGNGNYTYYDGKVKANMGALEIPMLFAFKAPLGASANLVFRAGAYMDIGLWGSGEIKDEYTQEGQSALIKFDVYGRRISGGAAYGLGVEFGRYMIGVAGKTGVASTDCEISYTSVGIEIGYKF